MKPRSTGRCSRGGPGLRGPCLQVSNKDARFGRCGAGQAPIVHRSGASVHAGFPEMVRTSPVKPRNRRYVSAWLPRRLGGGRSRAALQSLPRRPALAAPCALPCTPWGTGVPPISRFHWTGEVLPCGGDQIPWPLDDNGSHIDAAIHDKREPAAPVVVP